MCVYVCMYVCMCVYVCVCMYECTCMHKYTYNVYIYNDNYTYIHNLTSYGLMKLRVHMAMPSKAFGPSWVQGCIWQAEVSRPPSLRSVHTN